MVAVADNKIKPPLLDEAVGITDRPYQRDGINFLWDNERGMITDAPGLGKTPQAALAAECPCIIVCPTYLVDHWYDWLREHFPKRKIVAAKGNRQKKIEALLTPADFLIVNKEMLRTHLGEILVVAKRYRYKTSIFDESHHLRNFSTSSSRGAVTLAQITKRAYLLTATPIWKEADDLFMQLRIMYPQVFTSYYKFVDSYCMAETNRFGTKVVGVKREMMDDLNNLMDSVRIGRTYEEAKRDLPPVIENIVRFDFENPAERKRYKEAVETYRIQLEEHEDILMMSYMEVMHTLRNMTGLEKIDPIIETVESSRPTHEGKYVIFCWYRDLAERLAARLPDAVLITGDMHPDERRRKSQEQKPIIATLSALSEGVDLSWARMVLYAEEHWPPGSQVQSLMRVRRERQVTPMDYEGEWSEWDKILLALDSREVNKEPILVYFVMIEDSIDEVIHSKSRQRAATAKEVLKEALGIYL